MKVVFNILILFVFFISCQDRDKKGRILDTPTTGSLKIVADESLRPLVQTEVDTFNGIYTKADITVEYLSEADAIDAFLQDSARLAIVSRRLTNEEKKYFADRKITITEVDVALSGIALIINRQNYDSLISVKQLSDIMQGKITSWNQIGSKRRDGIEIVFDNPNSGLIRHLKDSIAKVDKLPSNCFAVKDNRAVVEQVSKNINALGLIGLEWISDKHDTTTIRFHKQVRVMAVAGDSTHFQPYQAYIALKHYPLLRTITIINNASRTGLNAGFSRFFASEPGQRIVLKAGLVPKTMPLRILQYR
jgi:phosphate transport system substrate-binding protein